MTAEVSRAPANDGLFPKAFAWNDRNGTAWFGVVIGALLPSLLMLWRYTSSAGLTVFTYLVDLTVVTVALPYFFSACAQLTYLVSRRRRVQGWLLARDLLISVCSVLFSMWVTFASGYQVVYQSLVVVLAGIILYALLNARREDTGQIPEPVDNLPDGTAAQPPDGTAAQPPDGTAAQPPDGTAAQPPDGTAAQPPDGTAAQPPDGTAAQPPDGTAAQPPDGTAAQPPNGTAAQPPNGTAAQPPNGTAAQPPNGTAAQPPNGTAAQPPNGTAAQPPNGTGPKPSTAT